MLTGGVRHGQLGEEEPIVKQMSDQRGTSINGHGVKSPLKKVYNPTNKTALFPPTENWMEIEERRRLFWRESSLRPVRIRGLTLLTHGVVVYILDRYASVSTGWNFEFGEEDVGRRLPCRDDNHMAGAVTRASCSSPPLPSAHR